MIIRATKLLSTLFSFPSSTSQGKALLLMRSQEEEEVIGVELLKATSLVS